VPSSDPDEFAEEWRVTVELARICGWILVITNTRMDTGQVMHQFQKDGSRAIIGYNAIGLSTLMRLMSGEQKYDGHYSRTGSLVGVKPI
jgi:hypothetical protein